MKRQGTEGKTVTVSVRVPMFSNYTIAIFKIWDSHSLCVIYVIKEIMIK